MRSLHLDAASVAIYLLAGISTVDAATLGNSGQTSLGGEDVPIRTAQLVSRSHGWALAGDRLLWTSNEGAHWTDITPPVTSDEALDAVSFLDNAHGWAMFHHQDIHFGDTPGIGMARTTNGGATWSIESFAADDREVTNLYGNSAHFSFVDAAHGWVLLMRISSTAASWSFLFGTSDGGKTWSRLPDPPVNGSIRFISQQTGWLSGGVHGDELYVTRDAGRSWERRVMKPPPQAENAVLTGYDLPAFEDSQHGTEVVSYDVPEPKSRYGPPWVVVGSYITADGGDTWQLKTTNGPERERFGTVAAVDSTVVDAYYAGNAIIIGINFHRRAARVPVDLAADRPEIRELSFIDPQNGWLLAPQNHGCVIPRCKDLTALLGTEDGGKTVSLLLQNVHTNLRIPGSIHPPRQPPGIQPPSVPPTPGPGAAYAVKDVLGMDSCYNMETLLGDLDTAHREDGYVVMGFYLQGGATSTKASCWSPNPPPGDNWMVVMTCEGWYFEPIWDDLQAPCNPKLSQHISTDPGTANTQGTTSAKNAAAALAKLGLSCAPSGKSIAYLDIEKYDVPAGDTTRSPAVRSYVNAWDVEMHKEGCSAGVYGDPSNLNADMTPGQIANVPDYIWGVQATGGQYVYPMPPIPNSSWEFDQRTRQYAVNQQVAWMPAPPTFEADNDWVDGLITYYSNQTALCQSVCTNPCNPACPDYNPSDPSCSGPPACDCNDCSPEGGPQCCCSYCNINCN